MTNSTTATAENLRVAKLANEAAESLQKFVTAARAAGLANRGLALIKNADDVTGNLLFAGWLAERGEFIKPRETDTK